MLCNRGLSIFIAEDTRLVRALLVGMLTYAHYTIAYAAESRQAADAYLARAKSGDFQVAVLDGSLSATGLSLSKKDGRELAAYIRAHHPGVQIIGFSQEESIDWAEFPIRKSEGVPAVLRAIQDYYLSRGFSGEI